MPRGQKSSENCNIVLFRLRTQIKCVLFFRGFYYLLPLNTLMYMITWFFFVSCECLYLQRIWKLDELKSTKTFSGHEKRQLMLNAMCSQKMFLVCPLRMLRSVRALEEPRFMGVVRCGYICFGIFTLYRVLHLQCNISIWTF